jgi:hypothetical protein
VMVAELEEADRARAFAEHCYAVAQGALAESLAPHGPIVVGITRYVGLAASGLRGTVVRRPVGDVFGPDPGAVVAAEAACDVRVIEDDGAIEP